MAISQTEAAYQFAHAKQSKTGQLIGSTAALSTLATLLVLARFITRVHTKIGLKIEYVLSESIFTLNQSLSIETRLESDYSRNMF